MIEELKHYFASYQGIDNLQLNEIASCFRLRAVGKNTILVSPGETCRELYIVKHGCVRTYYLTNDGLEKTRYIGLENSVVGAMSSFISQKESFEYVQALEDSELYAIGHRDFYQLVSDIPQWDRFYTSFLETAYLFQNNKIEERLTLSAGERYERLMKENPQLIQRVSNKILASYLDMAQETLSRLKSR